MKLAQSILLWSCPALMGAVMASILWLTPLATVCLFVAFLFACFAVAVLDELESRRQWREAQAADAARRSGR